MEMAVRSDRGSGSTVVLLHGFPGNGADWEPVAHRLSEHYRVVVVDLLGFGSSARPTHFDDVWVSSQTAALAGTLDRLGIGSVALAGHDMGGPVALTFLREFPHRVTHLALLATNTFGDTPVDFPLSLLRLPVLGSMLEPLLFGRVALTSLGRAASRTRGVHPAPNDAAEAKVIRTIFGRVLRDLPALYRDVERTLAAISVPTTVIWGDRDMFFSAQQGQRTAGAIPGATFVLLEGCGHFPPIERREAVTAALLDLLNGA